MLQNVAYRSTHVAATELAQVFQTTSMISDAQCDCIQLQPVCFWDLLGMNLTKTH